MSSVDIFLILKNSQTLGSWIPEHTDSQSPSLHLCFALSQPIYDKATLPLYFLNYMHDSYRQDIFTVVWWGLGIIFWRSNSQRRYCGESWWQFFYFGKIRIISNHQAHFILSIVDIFLILKKIQTLGRWIPEHKDSQLPSLHIHFAWSQP